MRTRLLVLALIGLFSIGIPLTAQESTDANKALALRYVEEVYNANNTDIVDEILADDIQFYGLWGIWSERGKTSIVGYIHDMHGNGVFETYKNPILISEGDTIAMFYIVDHDRVTYKAVTPGIIIMRIDNSRIGAMMLIEDIWYFRKSLITNAEDMVTLDWFPSPGISETTADENRALAASAIELLNTGETNRLPEIYADDLVFHLPAGITTEPLNRDGLAYYISWLRTVMPDLTIVTEDKPVIAEGDLVLQAHSFTGNIMPSGTSRARPIKAEGISVYRIEDSKIAEVWWHWQPHDPDSTPFSLFTMPPEFPLT